MGRPVPAARPASAPPVSTAVPAAALPGWPPTTNPAAPGRGTAAVRRGDGSPGQSRQGTVYGGAGYSDLGQMTVAAVPNPVETSGSLTGHILAQGWADAPTSKGSTTKVIVVLLAGLGLLVLIGLLVAVTAGDLFNKLFGGLLQH
jgi:hypothetical protein